MNTIKCKARHKGKRGCKGTGGCAYCGGFGIILRKIKCGKCSRFGWDWEKRCSTFYDGKQFYTIDGVLFTVRADGPGPLCEDCDAAR